MITKEDVQKIVADDSAVHDLAAYALRHAKRVETHDPGALVSFHHHRGVIIGALAELRDSLPE